MTDTTQAIKIVGATRDSLIGLADLLPAKDREEYIQMVHNDCDWVLSTLEDLRNDLHRMTAPSRIHTEVCKWYQKEVDGILANYLSSIARTITIVTDRRQGE